MIANSYAGFGMEYTANPKPGDYHVNGTGVTLRAGPKYTSKAIATLQNGEGIYVFGDVDTDPEYVIFQDDTVGKAIDPGDGIDYVRVGTQTHGPGWVAMPYIEPGAGKAVGQTTPAPSPSTSPAPSSTPSSGMGLIQKVLLGGAIGATVAGGAFLVVRAVQQSQSRRSAYA